MTDTKKVKATKKVVAPVTVDAPKQFALPKGDAQFQFILDNKKPL